MIRSALAVASLLAALASAGAEPVDCVNTGIGSISHMLVPTFRTVQLPNAMYRFNGVAGAFVEDEVAPIRLFTVAHRDEGCFPVVPAAPVAKLTWDQEHARPYRYDVFLDSCDVRFSLAPFAKGAVARFDFEGQGERSLAFPRTRGDSPVSNTVTYAFAGGALSGTDVIGAGREDGGVRVYLQAAFDPAPTAVDCGTDAAILRFGAEAPAVRMRFAVSFVSADQAARNLAADAHGFDLEATAADARETWNRRLSVIEVEGGTEAERRVFYTALWRTFERMVDVTEDGRYLGFDRRVHDAGGRTYYTDDWTWDSYRAHHPLMTILAPTAEGDKLQSFVRMAEQNAERWMPTFPGVAWDRHCMVNRHTSIIFLDAWRKGIRNFDARKAFELTDHTEETESLVPWHRGPLTELDRFYREHGYYPALGPGQEEWVQGVQTNWERRQSVSVTQGASYDAWAIAAFGRELGVDAARLEKYDVRAKGYERLWNGKTQFFHPKDADGNFIEPMDYVRCGGFGGRNYYTENGAWIYIWDVQHDLANLVRLFGGARRMEAKLDAMLNVSVGRRFDYVADMPDGCTGLMGVYTMANEPAFHIPYLYNLVGRPDKTQKFVRKTLDCWFRDDRMGMCGDEDGGGMSAYAVFSMMGFYPLTPGVPEYQWGSPVFRRVTIHLENGRDFVIEAPDASADAKYVAEITVDGVRTEGVCAPLRHQDILRGARIRLRMSTRGQVVGAPHK